MAQFVDDLAAAPGTNRQLVDRAEALIQMYAREGRPVPPKLVDLIREWHEQMVKVLIACGHTGRGHTGAKWRAVRPDAGRNETA